MHCWWVELRSKPGILQAPRWGLHDELHLLWTGTWTLEVWRYWCVHGSLGKWNANALFRWELHPRPSPSRPIISFVLFCFRQKISVRSHKPGRSTRLERRGTKPSMASTIAVIAMATGLERWDVNLSRPTKVGSIIPPTSSSSLRQLVCSSVCAESMWSVFVKSVIWAISALMIGGFSVYLHHTTAKVMQKLTRRLQAVPNWCNLQSSTLSPQSHNLVRYRHTDMMQIYQELAWLKLSLVHLWCP